jgi:hypothetical protein
MLNEIEKTEVEKFVNNPVLMGAVRKVLMIGLYQGSMKEGEAPDTSKNFAIQAAMHSIQNDPKITNDMLGEGLRASVEALRLIELGFQELVKMKPKEEKKKEVTNEAR